MFAQRDRLAVDVHAAANRDHMSNTGQHPLKPGRNRMQPVISDQLRQLAGRELPEQDRRVCYA